MMTTYKAVLHGDTIEWRDNMPQQVSMGQAVNVHITVLDQIPVADNRGQRMAGALSKLAQSGAFADVDGQRWEREIREDRPLVGRSEEC